MANVKISQLPSLSTMTDAGEIPVVDSGTTQQITGANLKNYFTANVGFVDNTIYDLNGLTIENSDLSHGATAILTVPSNGNTSAIQLTNTYGNFAVSVGAGASVTATMTFKNTGNLDGVGNLNATGLSLSGNVVSAINTTANVTTTANISGNYILGNGSLLTGVNVSSSSISNGTSNVEIATANGNATVTTAGSNTWNFDTTGNLTLPGSIIGSTTILIDNLATGNTADIQLYSADDILLQARDRTVGDDIEGGDINIFAGDGSPDDTGGGTGGGGDVTINGGVGGLADISSAGQGGFVRLDAGSGGAGSATASAGRGGDAWVSAGSGGSDNGGGGNAGGNVTITAGDTSDTATDRGSVILNSGGGGDETSIGGYVQISIPAVGTNPGGDWTFTGLGTVLQPPPNAEIFNPSVGNLTVGTVGNTIIRNIGGVTTYDWVFDPTGDLTAPGNISTDWLNIGNVGNITSLEADVKLQIVANAASNTAPYWTFNNDGNLFVPGNINGDNSAPLAIDGAGSGEGYISLPSASFGGEQIAIVNKFSLGNGIRLETNGGNLFLDDDGVLNVPGNIVMPPGTALTGSGASPAPRITGFTSVSAETLSATGNITGGNISITGNITGNYFIGNGSQLTGLPASYGNSNVTTLLANLAGNTISSTGNITTTANISGGYILGNGSQLTGLPASYGNSNVTTLLADLGSSVISSTGNITTTANISGGNVLFGSGIVNGTGNITTTANITGGNVLFGAGIVSGTGNITGGNLTTGGTLSATTAALGNTATVTTSNYAIGYRDIPQVSLSANANAALTDAGKHFYSTTAGNLSVLIPTNANVAFPTGAAFTIVVQAAGNVLVNADAGVTLYVAGNSTAGNRVVSSYGMATVMKVATDTWFINGTGVS